MGYLLLSLFIAIFLGCGGESGKQTGSPGQRDDFSIREGKRLFVHYCSPCHGEKGDGYGRYFGYGLESQPPDFTASDFLKNRTDERLLLSIRAGSAALGKSNLCPPWGGTFHQTEIEYLVAYIKKLSD